MNKYVAMILEMIVVIIIFASFYGLWTLYIVLESQAT